MTARIDIKRTVKEFDGKKVSVESTWTRKRPDGVEVFQHPTDENNSYNGEELEPATVDRTWAVKINDDVLDPDWSWDSVKLSEAEDIEALYGESFTKFRADFPASAKAVRLFILMLMKRKDAGARLKDADVPVTAFDIEYSDVDVAKPEAVLIDPSEGAPETPSDSESESATTPPPSPTSSESSEPTGTD